MQTPGRRATWVVAGAACGLAVILLRAPKNPVPNFSARDFVNAADYRSGAIAPGEVIILHPSNAGPRRLAEWPTVFPRSPLDLAYVVRRQHGYLIGGTRLFFGGAPAPIVYSVSGEVEAVVPDEVAGRKSTQVVLEYKGARSRPVSVPVVGRAPALFTLDGSGKGQAAMLNETGCCNSPQDPATRGTIASLYATGEGAPGAASSPWPVRVTVGDVPAEVLYAGNVGTFAVNFRVPLNAPAGDAVPLVLTVGDAHSPGGVTMAIRSVDRRILILARQPDLRRRLAEILQEPDYEVVLASENRSVDLLITDLAPPTETRLQAIAAARSRNPRLRIAAIAVADNPEALRAADLLGAAVVLSEPLEPEAVRRRIRDLLRERPARY